MYVYGLFAVCIYGLQAVTAVPAVSTAAMPMCTQHGAMLCRSAQHKTRYATMSSTHHAELFRYICQPGRMCTQYMIVIVLTQHAPQ